MFSTKRVSVTSGLATRAARCQIGRDPRGRGSVIRPIVPGAPVQCVSTKPAAQEIVTRIAGQIVCEAGAPDVLDQGIGVASRLATRATRCQISCNRGC